MNTNVVPSIDARRKKQDGTYPVVLRLGHNESTTTIPTGYSVALKDWDEKNRQVRKSYTGVTSVTRLNNLIQKKKAEAMDVIMKLHESGKLALLSLKALREHVASSGIEQSFFSYAEGLIKELKAANRFGTASSYQDVVNILKTFHNQKPLSFAQVNYEFLTKLQTQHHSKGNSPNGLAVYMRTIRAIYNKAIKAGVTDKALYPFDDYKIKTIPTEKRALDMDALKRIIALDLDAAHECFDARNYFVASYMMYSMNYTDMAFMQRSDMKGGRVQYRRRKTSKLYNIKLTPGLEKIFSFYRELDKASPYVFPILRREGLALQVKDIKGARKRYNKKLKALAEMCGIETNLTSYVSRHSFATQAMLLDVPLNAISSMLGHSSLKTTEVYLKSLPSNILDDYNAKILVG